MIQSNDVPSSKDHTNILMRLLKISLKPTTHLNRKVVKNLHKIHQKQVPTHLSLSLIQAELFCYKPWQHIKLSYKILDPFVIQAFAFISIHSYQHHKIPNIRKLADITPLSSYCLLSRLSPVYNSFKRLIHARIKQHIQHSTTQNTFGPNLFTTKLHNNPTKHILKDRPTTVPSPTQC